MPHIKVNSDVILLGDVGLEADWAEDGLLIVQPAREPDAIGLTTGVRLILDAEVIDQLADLLDQHRRPRPAVRLRAVDPIPEVG
jgi:hypothetical protein